MQGITKTKANLAIVHLVFFATSRQIGKKPWVWSFLKDNKYQNMKWGKLVNKGPCGALQGSSKGPQITKIAENGKKNKGFVVVSSKMLLGRKILCHLV